VIQGQAGEDEKSIPSPVAIWPSGPLELVAAFPVPVSVTLANSLVGRTIPYFDATKPGGTSKQSTAPLGSIRIAGARLADDRRTLILVTDPHPWPAIYQLVLGQASQKAPVVEYDLTGVDVAWFSADDNAEAEPRWKGWWPDLDAEVSRRLTRGSSAHERASSLLEKPGRLVVSTLLKLPAGSRTLRIQSSGPISDAMLGDEQPARNSDPDDSKEGVTEFSFRSAGEPLFLTFTVGTGRAGKPLSIRASYKAAARDSFKRIERNHQFVPWAPLSTPQSSSAAATETPDLAGGDPKRGAELFFGETSKCSQCHAIGHRGGNSGPDLTEIGRKGRDHIYRSIAAPSAEIAPDYMPYTIASRDGRVFVGVVRADSPETIRVTDTNAKTITLARAEIDQIRPSGTSIMPVGLAATLGESNLRHLMAYLITLRTAQEPGASSQRR
jgi:putative heme-binding domain-containing protein